MINKLQRVIVQTDEEGTQVSKLPSNEQMMNKINEIIDYVNKNENEMFNMRIKGMFKSR